MQNRNREDSSLMSKERSRIEKSKGSRRAVRRRLVKESINIFVNGLLFRNPVAIGALGLFPVVGAGFSLANAAALSLMMLVMMLPVCVVSSWLRGPVWVRPAVVLVLSGLMYLPAAGLLEWMMPQTMSKLGVYGILMIGNSIVLSRANDYAPTRVTLAVVMDSLGCTAGFSLVILLVALARETWAALLSGNAELVGAAAAQKGAYPMLGFLLLGFIAALIQHLNRKRSTERRAKR